MKCLTQKANMKYKVNKMKKNTKQHIRNYVIK